MNKNIKRAITSLLVAMSILTIAPISAQAQWKSNNTGWWYTTGSSYYANTWKQIGGTWYYFGSDGYILQSKWLQSGGNWYYLQSNGAMAHDTYIGSYYLNSSGVWSSPPTSNSTRRPSGAGADATNVKGGTQDQKAGEALNRK